MEIFGNPIAGYNSNYYNCLLELVGKENKNYFCGVMINKNLENIHDTKMPQQKDNLFKYQKKFNINRKSRISKKGLEMRAKKESPKDYKIKKVKIPTWTYLNKLN